MIFLGLRTRKKPIDTNVGLVLAQITNGRGFGKNK